jgi:hypothetical protein
MWGSHPYAALGRKLPARVREQSWGIYHAMDADAYVVVIKVGDKKVRLQEPTDEFPSDKLVAQMLLLLG